MKRMILCLLSLLVVGMFVLSGCNIGEKTESLAGQAVKKSSSVCNDGWAKYCSTLLEGEIKDYKLAGSSYKIRLNEILYQAYAGGVHSATFNLNGKKITLLEGEEQPLGDGRFITLTEILYQTYPGGVHSAAFCITG